MLANFYIVLQNQHCIAIGTKAVALLTCNFVGIHNHIVATKCRNHHKLSRIWEMEVRHHGISRRKLIWVALQLQAR